MKHGKRVRILKRLGTLALVVVLFWGLCPVSQPVKAVSDTNERIVVSLGDSYSSGEGILPFYEQDNPLSVKVREEDWLAHRSEYSWPGMLTIGTSEDSYALAERRNTNWFFAAVSGAVTENLKKEKQKKEYNKKDDTGKYQDTYSMPTQLSIFDHENLKGKQVDYVTVTIGGNDMGFADVIKSCVTGSTYLLTSRLPSQITATWIKFYWGGIQKDIDQAYKDIADKAGDQAHIIVAGYPRLLDEYGAGFFFSFQEAVLVNNAVSNFNKELEKLVKKNQGNMNISFVSVEEAFYGHGAYAGDNAYIHEVILGALPEDLKDVQISSAFSMHPNKTGAEKYAACVQAEINRLESERPQEEPVRTTSEERDIVLVLDTSGSMEGTPIREVKEASINFVDTVLKEDASIGLVTYNGSADIRSDFSMNAAALENSISSIYAGGQTNIEAGLAQAEQMLSSSDARKRIIVLMSDGAPTRGKDGENLIEYADELKEQGIYLYTLGFFEYMGSDRSQAQQLMEGIASDGCHYEVDNAEDLVFFFEDIADQISGQKYIYVRIACPVDVTVKHDGQTLRSDVGREKTRTDFGTLTFEENTEDAEEGEDNRIKILRLKEGTDYDIQIEGNGRGTMDYTIGFMDEDGEYSDLRKFRNIKITKKTVIDTVAAVDDVTTLYVDEDGDGSYDLEYEATENGRGKLVETNYLLYTVIGVGVALVFLTVILLLVRRSRKKKMKTAS